MYQIEQNIFVSNFQFFREKLKNGLMEKPTDFVKKSTFVITHSGYASLLVPVLKYGIQEILPARLAVVLTKM